MPLSGGICFFTKDGILPFVKYHNLEDIWIALEKRYEKRENRDEIVKKLMEKIVDMFIFDILTGNPDRHMDNWIIVEYPSGKVDLQPLFDNARAFFNFPYLTKLGLPISKGESDFQPIITLEENLYLFLKVSSKEFVHRIYDSLWVLSEKNDINIIERIERKVKGPIPNEIKSIYKIKWETYLDYFQEELNVDLKKNI